MLLHFSVIFDLHPVIMGAYFENWEELF